MSHVDPEILALRAIDQGMLMAGAEPHLAQCEQCQAELTRLTDIVDIARSGHFPQPMERPPDRVWQRITAELQADADTGKQLPVDPPVAQSRVPNGLGRRGLGRRQVAGLAAVAVLIGAGVAVSVEELSRSRPVVIAQIPLRPLSQFPQWRAAAGVAVMAQSANGRTMTVTLHASPGRGFFEVWLLGQNGVKMISLGDLNNRHAGTFSMPPGVNLAYYSRIDISLQPFDGSTSHSKISVVRGTLP
jgi:Anti-sigma-K factor rskA